MFKKISTTIIITGALLFSGVFTLPAKSSANNDILSQQQGKMFYHINGIWNTSSLEDFHKHVHIFDQIQSVFHQNKEQTNKPEEPMTPPEGQEDSEPEIEQPNEGQDQDEMDALSEFEQQVVELTNQQRAQAGLEPLEADIALSQVARDKSEDMATNQYFDHQSPTYGSPFDMMQAYGVNYQTAGENIAKGQRTPEEVVNAWMNSEGHRENIMNPNFTHIGIGHVESGNYWTQMFIGK